MRIHIKYDALTTALCKVDSTQPHMTVEAFKIADNKVSYMTLAAMMCPDCIAAYRTRAS